MPRPDYGKIRRLRPSLGNFRLDADFGASLDRHHRRGGHRQRCRPRVGDRQLDILVDKAVDRAALRKLRAGAGHEEAGDRDQRNRADHAGGAGDALVVKRPGQPDLAPVDAQEQQLGIELARLAPHALVADPDQLAPGGRARRDHGDAVDLDRGRDFQHEALPDLGGLLLGGDRLHQAERDRRAGAQDRIGGDRCRDRRSR